MRQKQILFFISNRRHWDNYTLKSTESWSDRIKTKPYIIKHKKSKILLSSETANLKHAALLQAQFWETEITNAS